MISKQEYFNKQLIVLELRKTQVQGLLDFLEEQYLLSGKKVISVGCGVGTELLYLTKFQERIGLDTNNSILDFARNKNEHSEFICTNYMTYLDEQEDDSIDCIIALDIDSNILPVTLLRLAKQKLQVGGILVMTERENNVNIFNHLLLLPRMKDLKEITGENLQLYTRLHKQPQPEERDNIIVVYKK